MSNENLAEAVREGLADVKRNASRAIDANKERTMELSARLLDVEQRMARGGGESGGVPYAGGGHSALLQLLENSDGLKAVADGKIGRAVVDLPPRIFAQITSVPLSQPDYLKGVVALPQRRMTIRDLLQSVPTDAGAVTYIRETGFTNAAAVVSESDTKPESNIVFSQVTTSIVTVAHWIRVTTAALADSQWLLRYIEGRLRYGLAYAEELQILKGSGVGNNLSGLMTVATAYSGSSGNRIDVLRRAMGQLENTDFQPSAIILPPAEWQAIQLLKTTTNEYLFGSPGGENPARLWGLPVVVTSAMNAESFLVLDAPAAALLLDREQARLDVSTETGDDFITNRAHVRLEERLGLAILRTGALIKGEFGS